MPTCWFSHVPRPTLCKLCCESVLQRPLPLFPPLPLPTPSPPYPVRPVRTSITAARPPPQCAASMPLCRPPGALQQTNARDIMRSQHTYATAMRPQRHITRTLAECALMPRACPGCCMQRIAAPHSCRRVQVSARHTHRKIRATAGAAAAGTSCLPRPAPSSESIRPVQMTGWLCTHTAGAL